MTNDERTAEANGFVATYTETERERLLEFVRGDESMVSDTDATAPGEGSAKEGSADACGTDGNHHAERRNHHDERRAVIAQNREGYAMLKVRPSVEADELERYYGFDMALDHVAELLGVTPLELPIPEAAEDMGM